MLYIADEDNEEFLGPNDLSLIALQIHQSHGPSGPNSEYLFNLATALEAISVEDQHVEELNRLVKALQDPLDPSLMPK